MRPSSSRTDRQGGAALVALVCLSVIVLVVAGLIRLGADRAEHLLALERESQALWLVEAGLERAAAQLRVDPSYEGETWTLPPEALGGREGTVTIEVEETDPGADQPLTVRVRADYPSDGDPSHRARRSKVFQVRPTAGTDGGDS
ncbi:hypothetical protein [Tautonia sociabilis]|uniref:Type II secretion system protein n=1 Tax=Tautonia sociabilis TaxID=2080755 RepID=A0A432MLB5_9BACT|nr:hypothetical protein [Tautonia sociabilis]RUL88070.1 hypothetical protein TsocGM_09000 [Tautonia sociabilis]